MKTRAKRFAAFVLENGPSFVVPTLRNEGQISRCGFAQQRVLGTRVEEIQDAAIEQKVLAHMQTAERASGDWMRRSNVSGVGREALPQVLRSLKLPSIDEVDNLQTLCEIVLALETAAEGRAVKQ